jgi:hypothetical protein
MKALISKVQDAMTPKKKLTRKQSIIFWVILAVLAGLVIWFGYYHDMTGRWPLEFLNRPESILPPEMHSENQTYDQVINFIRSDDTNTIPYEFGFNCVDAAFRIWRNATWHGIVAAPIAIQYTDSPGHMVIGFPTNDKGDIFIEPQNDLQIRLRVGQEYNGGTVRGIYVVNYDFTPLYDSPPYDPNIKPE